MSTNNDGSVVSFAIYESIPLTSERTNERHDFLLQQLRTNEAELARHPSNRGRNALLKKQRKTEKGVKGLCILRPLSNFDVGRSFLVDSLHNVYLGLFVSMNNIFVPHYLLRKSVYRSDFSLFG